LTVNDGKEAVNVTENERNGHSSKTLKSSSLGNIVLTYPETARERFEPRVVPKHKRQLAGFEDKTPEGSQPGKFFLYDEYGMETSAEFISDVTDAILPEVEKWQNRRPFYTTVFFDAIRVKIRGDNGIVTQSGPSCLFPIPSGVFFLIDSFYAFL
jgi:transposase-like protein